MKPEFSRDPGADKLLASAIGATYTEARGRPKYEDVDKSVSRPNHVLMTDFTRQEVDAKLAASEAKIDARLANFDASVKNGFADLTLAMTKQSAAIEKSTDSMRVEMAQMRTEMAKQTGEMRTEMSNVRGDGLKGTIEITRWVIGFGIAILMAIFAMSRMEKPATAPAPPPAPIVIYAQPSGSVAPLATSAPQAAQK